jgi:hypothetical protein
MDILNSKRALRGLDHGHRRALVWALVAVLLLALAVPVGLAFLGRSGGGDASTSGPVAVESGRSADAASGGAGSEAQSAPPQKEGTSDSGMPSAAAVPVVDSARLARSAWLGIEVSNLTTSAGQVRAIAGAAGGRVTSENVVTAQSPEGVAKDADPAIGFLPVNEARLVLAVPTEKLDGVLTELSRLGTVSYRSSQSEDVTDTYVDTAARVKTMQAGVDRVRALLARATSLEQIVSLEAELSRRQADLEALQARLAALDKRVAEADVTVTLWTAGVSPETAPDDDGFVAALRGAWDAFLSSLVVILTGLAVMLPWLVIVLLVGLLVRRNLRRRGSPSTTD